MNANNAPARLIESLMTAGLDVVTFSMRASQDLAVYPEVTTHIRTYSSHTPSEVAVTLAISGGPGSGRRVPVSTPGIYPRRDGL